MTTAYTKTTTEEAITTAADSTIGGSLTVVGAIVAPSIGPSPSQQHTVPAVTSGALVVTTAAQTLTTKTLTAPVLGGATTLASGATDPPKHRFPDSGHRRHSVFEPRPHYLPARRLSSGLALLNVPCYDSL